MEGRSAGSGQMSEEGRPLTQGLKFKADQEHVCPWRAAGVASAFEEACLINELTETKTLCRRWRTTFSIFHFLRGSLVTLVKYERPAGGSNLK